MRKHLQKILFPLFILFFAFSFQSNPPQGWYEQVLPRTDIAIRGINFVDSLKGWAIALNNTQDSGFVLNTTNGGNNWNVQQKGDYLPYAIQMLSAGTGYIVGLGLDGSCSFHKTTNGGIQWTRLNVLGGVGMLNNLFFINKDTGWVCSSDDFLDGGVFKTTDGGMNWIRQQNPAIGYRSLFFLNQDTGWYSKDNKLYRTLNGGTNWNLQYTSPGTLGDVYFFNSDTGIAAAGTNLRTTNGGFNWVETNNVGIKISMATDKIGWIGLNTSQISKTTNGGISWIYQNVPIERAACIFAVDTLKVWAGQWGIIHTIDGGGPVTKITIISTVIPEKYFLHQNYPNPFNPSTIINYQLTINSLVTLKVYDSRGKEIATLVNEKQNAGTYSADFNAAEYNISSGIYFYSLSVNGSLIDTKKMILIK